MTREITILSIRQNLRKKVLTDVATLGELKALAVEEGFNVDNVEFHEGVSRTILPSDESVLPSNILHKGNYTNDLVIILSPKNTKIDSGMDRKAAYAVIKEYNLQEEVKSFFGKNFTNVSTLELVEFVQEKLGEKYIEEKNPNVLKEAPVKSEGNVDIALEERVALIEKELKVLKEALIDHAILDEEDEDDDYYDDFDDNDEKAWYESKEGDKSAHSDDDIEEMLRRF